MKKIGLIGSAAVLLLAQGLATQAAAVTCSVDVYPCPDTFRTEDATVIDTTPPTPSNEPVTVVVPPRTDPDGEPTGGGGGGGGSGTPNPG